MSAVVKDITIEQGASFSLEAVHSLDESAPIDLTGYQGRGQIRSKASSKDFLAEFDVTVTDPAGGLVLIELSAEKSSAIPVKGKSYSDMMIAYYDIELYKDDLVIRLLNGKVMISPEVTK